MGRVSSSVHAVVATTKMCALKRSRSGSHSQAMGPQLGTEGFPPADWCLQLHTQWSPPAGRAPSTAHGGDSTLRPLALNWARRGPDPWYLTPGERCRWVPTHGPGVLTHTRRGPHRQAVCPQPRTEWSSPTGLCALNSHEGRPHSRATRSQQRGPHLRAMGLQMGMKGFPPRAVCLHQLMEGSALAGSAPSSTQGKIPTRGLRALNWARRGPYPWCVRPRKRTDGSLLAGLASSPSHERVPTVECPQPRTQWSPPTTGCAPSTPTKESPLGGRTPSTSHGGPPAGPRGPQPRT